MKVLLSWLREYVDVPVTADEIARTMSVRGFAVEGIDEIGADAVIDFEVTGNRPDCMSMLGMAREVATAYGLPLSKPELARADTPEPTEDEIARASERRRTAAPGTARTSDISITIDNPELCRCYAGAAADVTIGPSPDWMQARLKASGIRPISNIVDITNYVLLELGQPMHAFDKTKLTGGEIRVRTARAGERLKTLDGQERTLSPEMLVIADAERPVAVAGVMGGADSEVNDRTRTIVFESAHFNAPSVRRTSRTLGLKTEASTRFERGADLAMPAMALLRALMLLEQIGAGTRREIAVAGFAEDLRQPKRLTLRRERITSFLGTTVPDEDVMRILDGLGFIPEATTGGWTVIVPPRRVDIAREVDLIEEVARHYGFDKIPSTFPPLRSAPPPADPRISRARRVRHVMTGVGFSEAVTFGFMSERAALPFAADGNLVRIKNPLSEAFAVLRPSLLPGLIESAAGNVRRARPEVRLFEAGNRFIKDGGERQAIAFVWAGAGRTVHWSEKPRPVDFFDAKSVVIDLALAHQADVEIVKLPNPAGYLTPGKAAAVIARPRAHSSSTVASVHIGVVGELANGTADAFGLPAGVPVYVAELDWEALAAFEQRVTTIGAVPKYPAIVRDISILVDEHTEAASIRASIEASAGDILEDLREFDRYQGKGVPEGKVSLSLRLTFRSPERTLTDADVQRVMDAVLGALKSDHDAVQR